MFYYLSRLMLIIQKNMIDFQYNNKSQSSHYAKDFYIFEIGR